MKYILSILLTCVGLTLSAQNLPERGELRKGNKAYSSEDYPAAMEHYSKAMAIAPDNFEARYNLANALIKSKKMDGADPLLKALVADSLRSDIDRSEAFYNLGNSLFEQEKLEEALESYKDAIRLNPDDMEAKYNYSYVKTLLSQQQQDQDQDQQQDQDQENKESGDEGDQNQDQQQDQQEGDDEQNQNQNQDKDQQQDQDQGDEEEQPAQPEPQDGEISEQELQQMLDAIQAQEDKTQEDMEEKARGVVIQGAKNW